jgi:Tfp pilus assembly protein PilN
MRPVNLIPAEDRRGDQAPLRTGPLAYIVMGALVAVLIGVAALVLAGNQVSERTEEVTTLKREDAAASAQAAKLASYTQFRDLSEQRVVTVQSLADSRFDWERVLRELSLILPSDVSLTELSASGAGGEGAEGSEGGGELSGLAGPSLTMSGCAAGYAGVASFVTALKDIDGVTRVGVQSSSETSGSSGGGEGECGGGSATVQFTIVVAFDAAPVPAPEGEAGVTAEAAPEAAQAGSSEASESSGEEAEGG